MAHRVLDIGCGKGSLGLALRERQMVEVVGIESDAEAAQAAIGRLSQVLVGDFEALPTFPDAFFDVVVCQNLVACLRTPIPVLRQIAKCLKPDGCWIARVPNARHHRRLASLLEGRWTGGHGERHRPLQFYTRREIEKLCYRSGFALEGLWLLGESDLDTWHRQGQNGQVHVGRLQIDGLTVAEAEEFYATSYLLRAQPKPSPNYGMTSLVIVTHNQVAYTRECVANVRLRTDEPYELIFVDNGSTDGTVEYLRSLPSATVIANPHNRGFPAAANQGLAVARGQQVLLLNNDTVVTTGWLRRLLRALYSDPRIGLVGPSSNWVSGGQQVAVRYAADLVGLDGFAWDWGKAQDGVQEDTDRLVGFCLLVRRDLLDTVGMLDERFGIGCYEDDDYCVRALRAGFRAVIARDSFVHHYGHRTFLGSGADFASILANNRRKFMAKWDIEPGGANPGRLAVVDVQRPAQDKYSVQHGPGGGLLLVRNHGRLSLCMIVRDNARIIKACLESIRPWVDEMIVVDTGSTDETPQIAQELGAQVFRFPWCDSFSAARNESLRHACGQWIFWMDSDDIIDAANGRKLRELASREIDPALLGFVMQVHFPGPGIEGETNLTIVDHVKLFRNRPDLRFERRIHEQILPAISRAGGDTAWTDIFVVHANYDHTPQGQRKKLERDLRLLYLELQQQPDHPFTLYNLGMTYADQGDCAQAIQFLQRSIACAGPGETHLRKAYALLVYSYGQVGASDAAWETCQRGLQFFPEDVELRFRQAILLHDAGRLQEAAQVYQGILDQPRKRHFTSVDPGIGGFKTRQNLALVFADMGEWAKAEEQWRIVTQDTPRHRSGWRGLGDTLLRLGKHQETLALAERLLDDPALSSEGRLLMGRAALARGDVALARGELQHAVATLPDDPAPLRDLCQLLFEQAEPAETEGVLLELLRRVPEDASAHHNLGTIRFRQGNLPDAAKAYQESLRYRPHSVPTLYHLGCTLQALGRFREAVAAWEQALQLDPGHQDSRAALAQMRR